MRINRIASVAALITSVGATALAEPSASVGTTRACADLTRLKLPHTTITIAEVVPVGGFTRAPSGRGAASQAVRNPVAFCRVAATLTPTSDSDIKVEVWMPVAGWNGKFQGIGNGGWAGIISYPALADAIAHGYAAASTDTGHSGDGGTFALGHPEKFVDFAWRSVHEMTVAAKSIVAAFYGKGPQRSYWNGCSTGGRQGLMEAQRFPADYDGIVAGAPANPRMQLNAAGMAMHQALWRDPASAIPAAKYPIIHDAVLAACDGLDGLKDRLIQNPTRCQFDPAVVACKTGDDPQSCLTPPQVEAARTIMSPVRTRGSVQLLPRREPGSEIGWGFFFGGPEPIPLVADSFKYIVFKDPTWDWRTFDLDRDLAKADAAGELEIADVANANLSTFVTRGGKLLMYHGWSDALIPPGATINFYNRLAAETPGAGKPSDWVRLFMAPGMGHCRGGDGPNSFDAVAALDAWVEARRPPERIIAIQVTSGAATRTRPLCPYPQLAVYTGKGSIDDAANFACKTP
jgi:tannase/feruloyl esterase